MALKVKEQFKDSLVQYRPAGKSSFRTILRLGDATEDQLKDLKALRHPGVIGTPEKEGSGSST